MALISADLNAGVVLVVTGYSDRCSLPLPPPPVLSVPASTSSETTLR